jgi:hypothetical protein
MKPETESHIKDVEKTIGEVSRILALHTYPDDTKTVMVMGFLSTMIEHHKAMLLLIRNGRVGSAFALARSIVEGMYRGMWINACASAEQIESFDADDKFPVNMPDMATAIDEAYRAGNYFVNLKERGWAALCSYSHSGMLQLGRRFTGSKVIPNYRDVEVYEVTTTVTTCILLLAATFLKCQNHDDDSDSIDALGHSYGPAKGKAE